MTTGIYKLLHTATQKYYIGSSVNIEDRYAIHMSFFRNNKNIRKLQALYDIDPTFELIILETCRKCDLGKKEKKYLRTVVRVDPMCVNTYVNTVSILRGKKKTAEHKTKLMKAMIGKNGKARLSPVTTFISPDGVEYNVTNIKEFANKHGVSQSALNSVANGRVTHYLGWRLSTTDLNTIMQHKLPEHLRNDIRIIDPDGNVHITKNVAQFEKLHNVIVHPRREKSVKTSIKKTVPGIDIYGRGWYIEGTVPVYTLQNMKTGQRIDRVISTSVLAHTLGIKPSRLRAVVTGVQKRTYCGWYNPSCWTPSVKAPRRSTYVKKGSKYSGYGLVDPLGTVYYPIANIREFCEVHKLNETSVRNVFAGRCSHIKGWTRYIPGEHTTPPDVVYVNGRWVPRVKITHPCTYVGFVAPDGTVHSPVHNLKRFAEQHGLHPSGFHGLHRGKVRSYKGWTVYTPPT